MSTEHLTATPFAGLGLADSLLQGVRDAGFVTCTPIQAQTLPLALAGRDVAGQAQTGTGKTAAFLLASFHHLLNHPAPAGRRPNQPRAVMLAPTRELAIQIHKDAEVLGKYTGFKLGLVYGGTGYDSQRRMLEEGIDILIGTPGRIIDYFKQHVFDLKAVQVMVLDEADRMFDLGFIKDIRFLLNRMPPPAERLGMLFSATLAYRVLELAYEHMNTPELIKIETEKVTADKVTQIVYHTANDEKIPLLVGLLRHMDATRSLVFTNTKGAAERVQGWLAANGLRAEVISGDVPQLKRQRLLTEFSSGQLPIMVATDVAARGLHIPDVSHVFNFDLPQDAEDYVHRIGRTARAGATGDAVSFACEEYAFSLLDIEQFIGHKIPVVRITPEMLPALERPAWRPRPERVHGRDRHGGGRRDAKGGSRGGPARGHHSKPKPHAKPEAHAPRPPPEAPKPAPVHEARPEHKPHAPRAIAGRRRQPEKPAIG
ncbi:MAG: ATP-dependent RNA helicase RhlB [Gammaproteobacteria bacterium]|nr:ATP-dependent RNA helicase RhlB [Gammaproteobacteria bacterium]